MSINVNSLGFAGHLAAKTMSDIDYIKQHGPLKILENISDPVEDTAEVEMKSESESKL